MTSSLSSPQPGTVSAERDRLVLLCQLDRARIELMLRTPPARRSPLSQLPDAAQDLLQAARFVPGAAGRWARHLTTLAHCLQPLLQRLG